MLLEFLVLTSGGHRSPKGPSALSSACSLQMHLTVPLAEAMLWQHFGCWYRPMPRIPGHSESKALVASQDPRQSLISIWG